MNKYELALVLDGSLDDAAKEEQLNKVKGYVTRFGGVIEEPINDAGKKTLAYEINHKTEGYYYYIHFESDATAIKQIDDFVRIMESVLRFMIISL